MLRRFFALAVVFTVILTGFTQPAFAVNQPTLGLLDSSTVEIITFRDQFNNNNDQSSSLVKVIQDLGEGAVSAVGGLVGVIAVCSLADAAATTLFPPAAVIAPYCPALSVVTGGATVTSKVVPQVTRKSVATAKVVPQVLRRVVRG